jgi:hypothetical protein
LRTQTGFIREISTTTSPRSLNKTALEHVMDLPRGAIDHPPDLSRSPHNFEVIVTSWACFALHVHDWSRVYELRTY